jgi:hypothetical protein
MIRNDRTSKWEGIMASRIRIIVQVVLIAGCLCERLAASYPLCGVDQAGKFTLNLDYRGASYLPGSSPAERNRLEAKITALNTLIQGSRVFNPPLGFTVEAFPSYSVDTDHPERPFRSELMMRTYPCLVLGNGDTARGPEAMAGAEIYVNSIRELDYHPWPPDPANKLPDGRMIRFMPSATSLRLSGFTVYLQRAGGAILILTKRDRPLWVPVTREELIQADLRSSEAQLLHSAAVYAEHPTAAELKRFEDYKRTDKHLATLHSELEAMTPAERASQAWWSSKWKNVNYMSSGLVPADAPESQPLWAENRDFFDRSRPRTDFQIITVFVDGGGGDGQGGYLPPKKVDQPEPITALHLWRMYEFLTTTNWQRIAALLD